MKSKLAYEVNYVIYEVNPFSRSAVHEVTVERSEAVPKAFGTVEAKRSGLRSKLREAIISVV